jgi:hypothetical protein
VYSKNGLGCDQIEILGVTRFDVEKANRLSTTSEALRGSGKWQIWGHGPHQKVTEEHRFSQFNISNNGYYSNIFYY